MQPSPFQTEQERYTSQRKNEAIKAEITIGGKLLCLHDYVCFGTAIKSHLHDWGFRHICRKCGKSKVFKEMIVEPLPD